MNVGSNLRSRCTEIRTTFIQYVSYSHLLNIVIPSGIPPAEFLGCVQQIETQRLVPTAGTKRCVSKNKKRPSWGSGSHLGSKLGGLGAILSPSWGVWGPSWLQVGGSEGGSWGDLGAPGVSWGPSWQQVGFNLTAN